MSKLADPNDRYSYEAWMNDLAADDSKPARGWKAQYQPRCDCCAMHTIDEIDSGKCDCCGKPISPEEYP